MTIRLPPLYIELSYQLDSAYYFESVRNLPWPIFLDSANTNHKIGRYDIIAADPFITLETLDSDTDIRFRNGDRELSTKDPFDLLQHILKPFKQSRFDLLLTGGAMGYFGYDLGRRLEKIFAQTVNSDGIPEMSIGIYDWVIVSDHRLRRCYLASGGLDPYTKENWANLIAQINSHNYTPDTTHFTVSGELQFNLDKRRYHQAFN